MLPHIFYDITFYSKNTICYLVLYFIHKLCIICRRTSFKQFYPSKYTYYIIYSYSRIRLVRLKIINSDSQKNRIELKIFCLFHPILLDNLKMCCIIYTLFNFLGGIITIYG